jgi:hypothetical protein
VRRRPVPAVASADRRRGGDSSAVPLSLLPPLPAGYDQGMEPNPYQVPKGLPNGQSGRTALEMRGAGVMAVSAVMLLVFLAIVFIVARLAFAAAWQDGDLK